MDKQTRAIFGIFLFGLTILGIMIVAMFALDMFQYFFGRRVIFWDREFITLASGIVFLTIGYIGLKRLNKR